MMTLEEFKAHFTKLSVEEMESGSEKMLAFARSQPQYAQNAQFRADVDNAERLMGKVSEAEAARVAEEVMQQVAVFEAHKKLQVAIRNSRNVLIDLVLDPRRTREERELALVYVWDVIAKAKEADLYDPKDWAVLDGWL
jgi:hypothetical protein